jgi:hypothetical protein
MSKTVTWGDWRNYDFPTKEEHAEAEELVIQDLVKSGKIITGFMYQDSKGNCPYIDGKPLSLSYRGWGRIMAEARNRAENTDKYDYCDFAWS